MIKFDVDLDGDCPVRDVLELLEKHSIKIEDFQASGPGGGNPCLILSAPTEEARQAFSKEWNDSEASAFSFVDRE